MNVLVTGANGQLGASIREATAQSLHRYIFTDIDELDITNKDAIRRTIDAQPIDVIVNCAAYTHVDKAEDDYSAADALNRQAVSDLATVAKESDAVLIHISTDYVFQGDRVIPYKEDDPPRPAGVYGKTKLAGEEAIRAAGCKHIIIRTSWLYSPYGHNFVKTMLKLTAENPTVKVVFDQTGTPTYAYDLATAIVRLIESDRLDKEGIYHFSNEGAISWYDFAQAINELAQHHCNVSPCHSDEFPSKAPRPAFSVLDKTKIKKTFDISIPYWRDSLKDCINRLMRDQNT